MNTACFCTQCGRPIDTNTRFCQQCGAPQANPQTPGAPQSPYAAPATFPPPYGASGVGERRNRLAYILLGIFLGALGIHNFYAGYTGKAVTQLLITVLSLGILGFVSFIWAIVDIVTVRVDAQGVPFTD